MLDELERKGSCVRAEWNLFLFQRLAHSDEIFLRNAPLVEYLERALAALAMSFALRTPDSERRSHAAAADGGQAFEKPDGSFAGICEGMEVTNELLECLE